MNLLRLLRIAILAAVGFGTLAGAGLAQKAQTSAEQNAGPVLPASFGNFTAANRAAFTPGGNPPASQSGSGATAQDAAAAAQEYGIESGETVTYSQTGAIAGVPATLTATLYRMKDPSGAYGEYSYLRTPEMVAADFTGHSSIKPDEALVLIGNLVLDVKGTGAQHSGEEIQALVAAVGAKAKSGDLPTLADRLPLQGRIDRTDHYILGPQTLDQFFPGNIGYSLGFAYGTEAETAQFRMGKNEATLLIADFPTPQIAQQQLDFLAKHFNVNGSMSGQQWNVPGPAGKPVAFPPPAFYAVRNQTLLAIVANAPTTEDANKLLDQVKAGTILTWSEPTFQFKEPSIEVMVVGAFVGTGAICLITLVGALAFSGFRLTVKKMFPNTVFDRSTQIDILQMGLVSKPIKAEDFYTFDGKRIDTKGVDKSLPDRTALRLFK